MFVLLLLLVVDGSQACDVDATTEYDEFESFIESIVTKVMKTECVDPLYINYFEGNLPTLKYKNYNSTVDGLTSCLANNFKRSPDGTSMLFVFYCPRFVLRSANEVIGHLLYKEMIGRGNLVIEYERFVIRVYAQLKYLEDVRGRVYYEISSHSLDVEVTGPVLYNFMHLFNDDKAKNDEINKLANDNWKTVVYYSKEIVCNAIMDEIIKNVNQLLRTVAVVNS